MLTVLLGSFAGTLVAHGVFYLYAYFQTKKQTKEEEDFYQKILNGSYQVDSYILSPIQEDKPADILKLVPDDKEDKTE